MKVNPNHITCNNRVIASNTLIPETFFEKLIGLRGQTLDIGTAMLFEVSNPFLEMFDTFFCKPLGCIAIDSKGIVTQKGIMQPNSIKLIHCHYWLEVPTCVIDTVRVGDKISGI